MSHSKSKSQNTNSKVKSRADWRSIQQRNRERRLVANLVTVVMLLLTILVLVWIAYQLNNPVAIDLGHLFHH